MVDKSPKQKNLWQDVTWMDIKWQLIAMVLSATIFVGGGWICYGLYNLALFLIECCF